MHTRWQRQRLSSLTMSAASAPHLLPAVHVACAGFAPSEESAIDLGRLHFPPTLQAWLQNGLTGQRT